MGAADVVPGVSGGTIALLTGIYERFITAIHAGVRILGRIVRGDIRGALVGLRSFPWSFIVPLLTGMLAAVVLLAEVIRNALVDHPEPMAAIFFGLVAASVLVVRRDVAWTVGRLITTLAIGAALFATLGWQGYRGIWVQ